MVNKAMEAALVEPVTGQGAPAADTPVARVFKRQVDAVSFLRERGFKVSASAFCRDLKAGRVTATFHLDDSAASIVSVAYADGKFAVSG